MELETVAGRPFTYASDKKKIKFALEKEGFPCGLGPAFYI